MNAIANILVALVAVLHVYFLSLEMFFWTKPLGLKTFRNTPEKAADSAVLAANQGLYNGFLAAGMVYMVSGHVGSHAIGIFCLVCALLAGLFEALAVKPQFLLVQAQPAAIALACVWLARAGA